MTDSASRPLRRVPAAGSTSWTDAAPAGRPGAGSTSWTDAAPAEQPPAGSASAVSPEAPVPDAPGVNLSALLAEALKRSDVCWIRTPDFTRLVWHVYDRDAVLLVCGPGEQQLPPLPEEVEIVLRSKDSGARLLVTLARAVVLPPEHPMWPAAAAALAAARLNAPEDTLSRWRESADIYVLHPFGAPHERPGEQDERSGAAAFVPARGTTAGWRPRHLGGRPGR